MNRAEIFSKIKEVLIREFEIENEDIQLGAKLYDDLDIDSIDAVNLIIELKSVTGRKIQLEELQDVTTVEDVVNVVEKILSEAKQ